MHLFDLAFLTVVQMKSNTQALIRIKLKSFSWEEKLFLGQEKREYKDNWTDLWENKIGELCIKNNITIMFM